MLAQQINLDKTNMLGMTFGGSQGIRAWWRLNYNAMFTLVHFSDENVIYKTENEAAYLQLYLGNQLMLPKGFMAEITGIYVSPQSEGYWDVEKVWMANIMLARNFGQKFAVQFVANDIFDSKKIIAQGTFTVLNAKAVTIDESRNFWITCQYRFGNDKVRKGARQFYQNKDVEERVKKQ